MGMIDQARNIKRTGMSREQAEAMVKVIPDATDDEAKTAADSIAQVDEMATKNDLLNLKAELKTDIHLLETRLTRLIFGSAAVVIAAVSAMMKLT